MAGEGVEVGVVMKDGRAGADGDGGDEAVDQLADGGALPAAAPIEGSGILVVGGAHWNDHGASEQAPEVEQMGLVARAGQDFHADGVADGEVPVQKLIYLIAGGGAGVAQELDPGGGVDQDHGGRADRMVSRSPSQPLPRRARASSTDKGSAATVRRAKLTAARLVGSR